MHSAATLRVQIESALAHRIPGALSPQTHSFPELLPIGITALDELLQGGIPRGAVTEISGQASTGRTTLTLSLLAEVTGKGSACAWIDVQDMFDPESAAACGVALHQLLWIRAKQSSPPSPNGEKNGKDTRPHRQQKQKPWSRLDQALKATDLLLQAGGFSVVVLDMGNVRAEYALRVPLASWYRFRLAAEQAQAALVLLTRTPCAKSCASLVLRCLQPQTIQQWSRAKEKPLFTEINFHTLRERKRNQEPPHFAMKKPSRSQDATWASQVRWMS